MNVIVPKISPLIQKKIELTYGFAFTPADLDQSILDLSALLPSLIELAQLEKTCDMLADEIEKTRRRVNAIEYVKIPNLVDTIHFIVMKLEDYERSSIVRLMKSKEIILAKNLKNAKIQEVK
jgi:V/A-type H+-transporting ATPase subunit D